MIDVTATEQLTAYRAYILTLQGQLADAEIRATIFAGKYQASEARAIAAEAKLAALNGAAPEEVKSAP